MKSIVISSILAVLLIGDIAVRFWNPVPASAQAAQGVTLAPQMVNSISQCAWPPGVTVTNGVAYCFVYTGTTSTSGLYWAPNGSTAWTLVNAPTASGVASFNGRTGAVTLTSADVTGTGLTATTLATTTLK